MLTAAPPYILDNIYDMRNAQCHLVERRELYTRYVISGEKTIPATGPAKNTCKQTSTLCGTDAMKTHCCAFRCVTSEGPLIPVGTKHVRKQGLCYFAILDLAFKNIKSATTRRDLQAF